MSPLFAWNDVVLCDDLGQLLSKWQQSWSSVPNNKRTTSFQELKSMWVLVSDDSKEVEFEEGWGTQTTIHGISGTSDIRG